MVTMTQIWFIAAAVLLLAELLVTTFFMLPFAIGSFFAGLGFLVSDSQNILHGTFVVFSIVGVYISIKIFGPKKNKSLESENFNEGTNKYIGKTFISTVELDPYTSTSQHVFGDDWQVVSIEQRIPPDTVVEVKNVSGTKLEVQTKEG